MYTRRFIPKTFRHKNEIQYRHSRLLKRFVSSPQKGFLKKKLSILSLEKFSLNFAVSIITLKIQLFDIQIFF